MPLNYGEQRPGGSEGNVGKRTMFGPGDLGMRRGFTPIDEVADPKSMNQANLEAGGENDAADGDDEVLMSMEKEDKAAADAKDRNFIPPSEAGYTAHDEQMQAANETEDEKDSSIH